MTALSEIRLFARNVNLRFEVMRLVGCSHPLNVTCGVVVLDRVSAAVRRVFRSEVLQLSVEDQCVSGTQWNGKDMIIGRRIGQAMLEGQRALFADPVRGRTFGGELTIHDWFVPVLFQERPDPVLIHRTGDATLRAVAERGRKIALGDLPDAPEHAFVGRSRELLAAERLLCGRRLAPDHGADAGTSDATYTVFRGEGGEGKTTLAVELSRWLVETYRFDQAAFVSVEQEASLHSVFSRLGRQLVSDYVEQSANEDAAGRRLIEHALAARPTLLLIDNLESILDGAESSSAGDVVEALFELLAGLNAIGRTRIVFTTRTPLPQPFDAHHIRIDRLSEGDAVELVSNVLRQSDRRPQSSDAGDTEDEVRELVESVNCHARSLVLLAREVSEQGVTATTANLRELMQSLHARCGDDRERSLFASVELSLRRLPPDIRKQLPPLAVFHSGFHFHPLVKVLQSFNAQPEAPASETVLVRLAQNIGEGGACGWPLNEQDAISLAARAQSELIDVGLAEAMPHGHVRVHPALCPYLADEVTAEQHRAAESAWSAAMSQLTSHLYEQQFKDTQTASEMTLLELPNLLAALEHRFQAVTAGEGEAPAEPRPETQETARQEPRPPIRLSPEKQAESLEAVIGTATQIEGLLQNLGRPQAMAAAESIRVQAATRLKELRGNDTWSHAQFVADGNLADRLLGAGRFSEAVLAEKELLDRCLQAGESAYPGAQYDLALSHVKLGRALKNTGSAASALEPLVEARTRFEQLADSGDENAARMASVCLTDYADCLTALGRLDEAAAAYEQRIEIGESRGDELRGVAIAKGQLGTVRLLQRRFAEALAAWVEYRQTFEQLGEPGCVATAWHQIGIVNAEAQQYEAAEHAYQQALHMKSSRGDRAGEASTLNQLGNLYSSQARREEAVRFYRQAADIDASPDIQNLRGEGQSRHNAADELIKLSRYDDARREILRAIECNQPFGHAADPWKTFGILSNLEQAVGNAEAAANACHRAFEAYLAYRRDGGENHNTGGQLSALVHQALATGDSTEATAQLDTYAQHPELANHPSMQAMLPALQAILSGSRDPALTADPRLDYDDAAELQFLLERLG